MLYAHDGSGRAVTGLGSHSPGAMAAYVREGEPASRLSLDLLSEIDADLMPGVYRLPLPDDLMAAGAPHAVVVIRFDGATVAPIDVELVAYDPLDERCIGMAQLQDKTRHEFLRRALPNLTEMEFEAGMDTEKQLSDFLAERGDT
jgi:hypothetical protein